MLGHMLAVPTPPIHRLRPTWLRMAATTSHPLEASTLQVGLVSGTAARARDHGHRTHVGAVPVSGHL